MQPEESENTKRKEFKILAKAFKKKPKVDKMAILEPYRKDIHKLRFEKKASYQEIVNLFKQVGIKVSKGTLKVFFQKNLKIEIRKKTSSIFEH